MSLKASTRKLWNSIVDDAYERKSAGDPREIYDMFIEVNRYIHQLEEKRATKKLARLLVAKMDKEENGYSQ